jgi:hypothetical protein
VTYCCLPCNTVWSGSARHVHTDYQEYRRGFWQYRLHRALKTEHPDVAAQLVEYPMPRALLARLLA